MPSRAPCLATDPAHDPRRQGADRRCWKEASNGRAKLQQLNDEKEIVDVMNAYTTALDTRDWEMLEATIHARRPRRLRQPRRRRRPRHPAGGRRSLPRRPPEPPGDAAPAGELRRRGRRGHRDRELLPPGEPLHGGCCRAANVFVVWAKYTDHFVRTGTAGRSSTATSPRSRPAATMNLFNEAAEHGRAGGPLRRARRRPSRGASCSREKARHALATAGSTSSGRS